MSVRRALRAIGGMGLALFAVLAFAPLPNFVYRVIVRPFPEPGPAPAIVVLGAGADDGVLTNPSLRRALGGVALFHRGLAPLVVMLGPGRDESEAAVRVRLAQDLGVPPAALLADGRGRTTREEARVSWEDLAPRGVRKILLVTGGEHMPRAAALFRRVGFEVVPAPVEDVPNGSSRPQARLELARVLLRELLAQAYNRAAGYL
jgi:uncharacterized SAM-binding protein YcdF (DUF218 family)